MISSRYLIQTNPNYLAQLVFIDQPLERWGSVKSAKFLQHVIQTTYNYASNARETYLLLKLFRRALNLEVTEKIVQVNAHPDAWWRGLLTTTPLS